MAADWSPSRNAYPSQWECRTGRWGDVYAIIRRRDIRKAGVWSAVFDLKSPSGQKLGTFDTGDAAAAFAYEWDLAQNRARQDSANRREHERFANVPARTERD